MDTKRAFKISVNLLTISSFLLSSLAFAAPEGGSVAQGSATISQSGNTTTINQTSQNTVINWNSFNTASHEAVQFNQPNSSAVALNRITNGLPTQFAGSLNANGQVWILNPAGVLFTSTAQVDVAGLVATTHSITNENFMAGNYKFDLVPGSESSNIINNGLISAKDSGIVALVAPHVVNNGLIQANLGKVHLASGAAYTLDMYGDSLINFGSNTPIQNGTVSNAGTVIANGGKVYMTANYAANVLDNMINMSGTIEAKSVGVNKHGEVVLYGADYQTKNLAGTTKVSGKISAPKGFVETSGHVLIIEPGAEIETGNWLIDPADIVISIGANANVTGSSPFQPTAASSVINVTTLQSALGSGNVIVQTNNDGFAGSGNITVANDVSWSSANSLTLQAFNNIILNAGITNTGGATLNLIANGSITLSGTATANITVPTVVMNAGAQILTSNTVNTTAALQIGNLTTTSVGGVSLTNQWNSIGNIAATNTNGTITIVSTGTPNIGVAGVGITNTGTSANLNILGQLGITQSSPISIAGTSTITTTNTTGVVTLTNPSNNFLGAVTVLGGTQSITNGTTLIFGGNSILDSLTASAGANPIQLQSALIAFFSSSLALTFNSPVQVTGNSTINAGLAGVGTITFNSTVNDSSAYANALTLVASSFPNFNGGLPGGTNALKDINIALPSINVDAVTVAPFTVDQLNKGTNVLLNAATTSLTVSSPITQTVNAGNVLLTLAATGANNINQAITLITGGSFVASGAPINLGANVSTGGSQSYNSATALTAGPLTLTSTASSIAFSSLSGAFSLIVNAATTASFGAINIGALDVTAPSGIATYANVTTVGDLSFRNSTFISPFAGTTYQTTGGGNILVTGSVADYATLIMNSSNILYLRGNFSQTYGIGATATNYIDLGANMYAGYGTTLNSPTRVTSPSVLSSGYAVNVLNNTVEGPSSLQLNQAGAANGGATNILYAVGTPGNPLSSFSVSQPVDNITVNAPIYAGTVSLYTNSNYMFNGGTITLGSAAVITATTFDANAAAGITFNGGAAVNTTGAQSYYVWGNGGSGLIGPIALVGGDVSLTGSTMTFYYSTGINSDAIATPRSLTVNGNAVFFMPTSGIGNTNPLNILHVTGTTSITTPVIHTTSNQLFDGAVTMGASSTLTSDNGDITFGNTVNGAGGLSLSVPNGNAITFNGTVGATTAINFITTAATGTTYINGGQVRTSSGAQNWNNQVYISADTILGGAGTTGPININFALDSLNSTHRTLTLNTTAMSFLNGNLGAINPLLGLTVQNAATINVNSIYTDVFQNYNGPLTLAGNSNLYTAALGTITFGSTIQGGFNLIANASSTGTVNFNNDIGTVGTPLTGLTVTGLANINTNVAPTIFVSGTQTYNNNVLLNSIAAITFGSGIGSTTVFNGTVNRTVTSTAITIAGNLQVGPLGSIGLSSVIASLLVNGSTLGPNVTTAGNQTYVGAVTLNTDETMTSTAGNITFNSTINGDGVLGRNLILSAVLGNIVFDGIVGGSVPLASLSATAGSQINVNTSAISTTGPQSYFGVVAIFTPALITFTGSDISFNQAILNGGSLITSISIVGNLILDAPSANLSTAGAFGFFDALTVSGSITVNNSSFPAVSTKQNQLYNGPVILNSDGGTLGFVGFASTNGNITFNDVINGASDMVVVVNSPTGTATFNGVVGGVTPLTSLAVNGNLANINTTGITTTGAQTYGTQVVLGSNTILTSTSAGINFSSTVNSDGTPRSLTLNAFLPVTLTGNIGSLPGGILSTLHVVNQANINTAIIHTVDAQLYDGTVVLGNNTKLTVDNGITGQIIFGDTITGNFGLVIDPPAIVQFNGDVNIASLSVQATQEIQINTALITTSLSQFYDGPVVLQFSPGSTLTSTFENITFNSTVDGGFDLAVYALAHNISPFSGVGTVAFVGTVGNTTPLNSLLVDSTETRFYGSMVKTLNEQTYINTDAGNYAFVGVSASNFNFWSVLGDDISFATSLMAEIFPTNYMSNITITGNLVLELPGGNIGATMGDLSLVYDVPYTLHVTGSTLIKPVTASIITYQDQTYDGPVTILGVGNFSTHGGTLPEASGGKIWFKDTVYGGGNFTIFGITGLYIGFTGLFPDTEVQFDGVVSNVSKLYVTGADININTTLITTIDLQDYTGNVNIVNPNVVLTAGTDVNFNNTVEGPGGLIVNVTSGTMFAYDHMGFNTPLGYLTVNGTAQGVNIISVGDIIMGPFNVVTNDLVQSLAGNVNFTGGPVTLFANLDVIAAEQIFFGAGANGVTGPFALSAQSLNPIYGPTGQGVTGTVNVASFTLGGPGGGHLSQNYPITESFVNGQGVGQAIMNTLISPDFRASGAIYCVNNFCTLLPVENPPSDIPPRQIINPPESTVCGPAGCDNLEILVGKNYCVYSEIEMNNNYYEYKKDEDKNKMYRKLLWKQEQDCLCKEDYRKINKDKYLYEGESKDKWANYCKQQKDLVYLPVKHHAVVPQKVSLKNVMAMMKLHHPVEKSPAVENGNKISLEHFPITKHDMYMR